MGAVVVWGLSQVGGEPRFSKVESVEQVFHDGANTTRTSGAGSDGADRPIVKGNVPSMERAPVGPTIGPPPDGSNLPNAGEPREIPLRPGVVPHISRFASTGAAKWTRLRQILIESGENDMAGEISSFQELLKQSRQGSDSTAEELIEAQEALVLQVEGMLTGTEVEALLADLREAVEAMQSAEAGDEPEAQ